MKPNGEIVYAYKYNDEISESPIMQLSYPNIDKDEGNYLTLNNDGSLSIKSKNNYEKKKYNFLPNNIRDNLDKIHVNEKWKELSTTFLDSGKRLGSNKDYQYIVSPNKKFKLTFNKERLVIRYCYIPFSKKENINVTADTTIDYYTKEKLYYYYTLPNNLKANKYEIYSHPLIDKILFSRNNNNKNIKTLQFLPNYSGLDFGNVLDYRNFTTTQVQPLYTSNMNETNITNNIECKELCKDNINCNYSYYDSSSKKCLVDTNNSIPIYIKDSNISLPKSYMNKKNHSINTTCKLGKKNTNTNIEITNFKDYSNYDTIYESLNSNYESHLINDKSKIGVCGDPDFLNLDNNANKIYSEGYTNIKEGLLCGSKEECSERADSLEKSLTLFNDQQQLVDSLAKKHNSLYTDYINNYNTYLNDTVKTDDDFNKDQGPELFRKNNDRLKTKTNKLQIMKEDHRDLIIHENTMYTIATISAATLIITAIILSRE